MATATSPNAPQKQDETSDTPAAPAVTEGVPPPEPHAVTLKDTVLPATAPGAQVDPDDLVDTAKTPTLMAKVQEFRARHEKWEMAAFFFGGFIYDVVSLSRIDDTLTLVQNFGYLVILTSLLLLEQRFPEGSSPPKFLEKVWRWREDAVHFLFGSLLSVFMLLLFKSTSGFTPYLFLVGLFALLVANELPRFRQVGPVIRVVLLSLCVTMYFACMLPVVIGRMGFWVFLLAVALGCANVYGLMRIIRRWRPDVQFLVRNVAVPGFGVQGALLACYLLGVIPPIPLAVQYGGIFHKVERKAPGEYHLSYVDRCVWYKPWTCFGPDFVLRPGEDPKVYYFFRIFAPDNFKKYRVRVVWYYDDPQRGWTRLGKGWMADVSSNGKEGGYRTMAEPGIPPKPGDWRVVIETEDGHEINRRSFSVGLDESTEPREFKVAVSVLNVLEPLSFEAFQKAEAEKAAKRGAQGKARPSAAPAPTATQAAP